MLVGQALRDGLKSRPQIASFVRKLQAGEAVFEDEASEGRTRSLAASLAYGFENTEAERKQLALLHFFRGFVDVEALRIMGDPARGGCLPEVKGLIREEGIALLDRASEVGLLKVRRRGYYDIHPALPWFFKRHFDEHHLDSRGATNRAFVEAVGELGNYCLAQYEEGNRDVIERLTAEEGNLLYARSVARSHKWRYQAIGTMQGLRQLYRHTGRRAEWSRLVSEIVPDFVDPTTEGPLPGKEAGWNLVTEYRVQLAREMRRLEEAARLQIASVDWNRQCAAPILARAGQTRDAEEKNSISTLAAALQELSDIRREQGSASCVDGYRKALSLAESVENAPMAASCAVKLGHAYEDLVEIRDLATAEQCNQRALNCGRRKTAWGRPVASLSLAQSHTCNFSMRERQPDRLKSVLVSSQQPSNITNRRSE